MVKILGIDPGLRTVGWGVIQIQSNSYHYIEHGIIKPSAKDELAQRLQGIFRGLSSVIEKHQPDEVSIEETFVNKNEASALKLGMARGVAMVVPANFQIPVFEYSANKVKKSIVGVGHADKNQILMMIKVLLPKSNVTQLDSADALAVALCHAHHRQSWLNQKRA